ASRPLSIRGPVSVRASGPPPEFRLDTGPGPTLYYAVEVASTSRLFDRRHHEHERSPDTFYALWQDTDFLSGGSYRLAEAAWERLRDAARLSYRAWFSSSSDLWRDVLTATRDSEHATAPRLVIERDGRTRDPRRRVTSAHISGPETLSAGGPPPVFTVELPDW